MGFQGSGGDCEDERCLGMRNLIEMKRRRRQKAEEGIEEGEQRGRIKREREKKQRGRGRQNTGLATMFVWANRLEDRREEKEGRWGAGRGKERSGRNSAPLYLLPGHQVGPNCLTQTLQGLYIRSNNCWRLML